MTKMHIYLIPHINRPHKYVSFHQHETEFIYFLGNSFILNIFDAILKPVMPLVKKYVQTISLSHIIFLKSKCSIYTQQVTCNTMMLSWCCSQESE